MSLSSTTDIELSVDCYATFDKILAHIPHVDLDNSTSTPLKRQALRMARDVMQEVNGLLGVLGYQIPIASSNSTNIAIVGSLCALGAASRIEASAASANAGASAHADYLRMEYQMVCGALRNGDIKLTATKTSTFIKHAGERTPAYSFHQPSGSEASSTFTKGMDW